MNKDDTICVKVSTYQKLVISAEQKKVLEERVADLKDRIAGFESSIKSLNEKDSATVTDYEKEIAIMKDQREIFEGEIKLLNKQVKKLKRKLFITSAAGIAGVTTLAVLYITK